MGVIGLTNDTNETLTYKINGPDSVGGTLVPNSPQLLLKDKYVQRSELEVNFPNDAFVLISPYGRNGSVPDNSSIVFYKSSNGGYEYKVNKLENQKIQVPKQKTMFPFVIIFILLLLMLVIGVILVKRKKNKS